MRFWLIALIIVAGIVLPAPVLIVLAAGIAMTAVAIATAPRPQKHAFRLPAAALLGVRPLRAPPG